MSPAALVILGLALAGILVWLLPDRGVMQERIAEQKAGMLSLIYLELGVHEHPEDPVTRLLLARRYYELSRYADAEDTLAPLLDEVSPHGRQARLLLAEVRHAHCAVLARTGNDQAEMCARDLLAGITAWLDEHPPLTPAAMERIAQLGAANGDGELATELYILLARNSHDPRERVAWYRKALDVTGSPALAAEIARAVLALEPNNPALIEQGITAELAISEVDRALDLARRLVQVDPANRRARERLATVADWAGRPLLAMDQWAWLARHGSDPDHRTRAMNRAMDLARGTWDQRMLLELSWLAARRRGMDRQDVLELARLYVRLGDPETARALLARQIAAHPDHRPSWEALRDVQLATADLDAAARSWAQIHGRFGTSEGERRERAALLWRARQPDQALAVLDDGPQHETDTVRLTAELAWRLEQIERAQAAYETLWRRGAAQPDEIQRLLLLAQHQGNAALAMDVALDRWRGQGDPQAMLMAMRMAADAGRWRDLDRMLDEAEKAPAGALEAEPEYWRMRVLRGHRRLRAALRDEDLARADRVLGDLDGDLARAAERSQRFARHPDYRALRADVRRQQLHVALQRGDDATVRRVLAESGDDIPPEDRVTALAQVGEHTRATRLAVRARRDVRDEDRRARLTSQAGSLAERVPRHVEGHTRLLALGGLRLFEAGGSFRFAWDRVDVGAHIAGRRLQPRAGHGDRGLQTTSEAELMALAAWRGESARTQVGMGAHVRDSGATPQLALTHERGMGTRVRGTVDLGIGRLTEETALLRGLSVRDHVAVHAAMDLDAHLFASARLAGMRFRASDLGRLGTGMDLEGAVGYRLLRGPLDWNVRIIGLFAPRRMDTNRWPEQSIGVGHATKLSLATTLAQGWPGAAPSPVGRLRYFAELAGGWLVATDTVDLALALGLGMPVFGGDELSITAALAGATDDLGKEPSQSITLRYARSLWQ